MNAPAIGLSSASCPPFVEVQRFRQPWLIAIVLGIAGLLWWGFTAQIVLGQPWGSKPAPDAMLWVLFLLVGIGFPALFAFGSMLTTLDGDGVLIRYMWVVKRRIAWRDIRSASAVTYHPIMDYGGWGVRWSFKGWCYNVSGNRGVTVALANGSSVLIGSQRPEELTEAIAMKTTAPEDRIRA